MATTQHIDEIASVYAASLLEVCDKQGGNAAAESCAAELSVIAEMIRSDKRFAEFLKSPIIGAAARRASIDRIVKGKVSDLVYRFVMVVAAHGRAGRLADIQRENLAQGKAAFVQQIEHRRANQAADPHHRDIELPCHGTPLKNRAPEFRAYPGTKPMALNEKKQVVAPRRQVYN